MNKEQEITIMASKFEKEIVEVITVSLKLKTQ